LKSEQLDLEKNKFAYDQAQRELNVLKEKYKLVSNGLLKTDEPVKDNQENLPRLSNVSNNFPYEDSADKRIGSYDLSSKPARTQFLKQKFEAKFESEPKLNYEYGKVSFGKISPSDPAYENSEGVRRSLGDFQTDEFLKKKMKQE
jgi:hypothetical protein